MSPPWIVAIVLLWLLLSVLAVAVIALARQVGMLTLRIRPIGPGSVDAGPAVGTVVALPPLRSLRSDRLIQFPSSGIGLLLFASPSCGLCETVLVGAARLARVDPDLTLTIAVDDDKGRGSLYLQGHGFADGVDATHLAALDSGHRPYAVALSSESVVLAKGAVNTLDQLEALADVARERLASGELDVATYDHGAMYDGDADELMPERVAQTTSNGAEG